MSGILISLAAVILVVLVIGFFAMRFLRADDAAADDFDLPGDRSMPREDDDRGWRGDGRPARGRSRGGPADGPRLTGDGPRLAAEPPRRFGGRPEREPARDGFAGSDRRPRGGRDGDRGFTDRGFTDPGFGNAASFDDFDGRNFDRPAAGRGAPREAQADRSPGPRRPAAPASRGRGKGRPGEPDWDSMSDVDYWTELASDKSLTNGVQPATAARSDHPATDSRADRGRDAAGREDATALLPARRRPDSRGPAESGPLPAASGGRGGADGMRGGRGAMPGSSSRGARPDTGSLPGRRSRDQRGMPAAAGYGDGRGQSPDAGVAALARLGTGAGQLPAPLNDDPLTSPSFPAVSAADGRSYRSGRSDGGRPDGGRPNGYPAGGQYPDPAADPLAGYGRPADSTRPNGAHSTGPHSSGGHPNGHLNGSQATGAHAGGLLSGEPSGLLSGGDPGAGPGGRHKSQASGLLSGGNQGDWAGRYGPADAAANGTGPGSYHPAQPALPAGPAAPPPVTAPAPAAASYRDYAEPPASGNPYGSYVTPAAEAYSPAASGRADSEPRYEAPYGGSSYLAGQETQQYAQPAGRHLASSSLHAAPVPAAPALPAGAGALHAAPVADPHAGYGNSHGGNGHNGNGHGAYYGGAPANGYSNGHGSGHHGHAGIPDAHGQQAVPGYPAEPEYPAAGYGSQPYDQTAYLPADSGAAQHDQRGYGTPDAGGYGSDTYGGYPGY